MTFEHSINATMLDASGNADSAQIDLNCSTVTTTGEQKYKGKVELKQDVTLTASSVTFEGELKDGTFDLKGKDANKTEVELKGSIADTKDGHITLTVASGYIDAKAYSLTFEGTAIAALMEWTLR